MKIMDTLQEATELTPQKQAWIDFVATAGVTIDEEGERKKITAEKLSKELKVNRVTLYRWRETIPNFWQLVARRRDEIYSHSRMTVVYNAMLKKAEQGDVAAAKLLMNQSSLLKAEKQENKVEHTGTVQFTNEVPLNADTPST
jgi:hypothetical protein